MRLFLSCWVREAWRALEVLSSRPAMSVAARSMSSKARDSSLILSETGRHQADTTSEARKKRELGKEREKERKRERLKEKEQEEEEEEEEEGTR